VWVQAVSTMKEEFVSSMSQGRRTPRAAIKASVGVVRANEPAGLSEHLHRMLVAIDGAADDLSEMVANVLEIARLQAHGGDPRRDWIDLRVPTRRALECVEPMAKRKDQRVEAHLPGTPLWVACDANRVERAVSNLL